MESVRAALPSHALGNQEGVVSEHKVTPHENGYFEVLSGNSGETYRVTPWASGGSANCQCMSFRRRAACSHIEAVKQWAANRAISVEQAHLLAILEDEQRAERRVLRFDPFARINRRAAEDRRRYQ